ncbi:MAG: GNAT family N-acetyltransferase [Leptolyngbyaceae cyanobacterium CSU_1_4]|nr:GNAT family N-acetyltransferase [Leptolyngbyaceae cyanobacterium CSU_1_4]
MLLIPGYSLRVGSGLDRALLLKFMQRTYQELYPAHSFAHLAQTIEQYLSSETPLLWVEQTQQPIGCLWLGNATDQVQGDRHSYIFLLYVQPTHRRQGIGAALMQHAENLARERGDRQLGLQVFQQNQVALNLYAKLGYEVQSLWMTKTL